MKSIWQHSYAVDGDMDQSSSHIQQTCWPRCEKSEKALDHCLALYVALQHWLRLQTHMEWLTHPPQTYEGVYNIHMLWMGIRIHNHANSTSLVGPDLGSQWNPVSLLGPVWSPTALVEESNTHGMVYTSTPNIWKMFGTIHMLWMGIWIHHHAIFTLLVVSRPRFGESEKVLGHCLAQYEALLPWLRLQTHMEWLPHLPQAYGNCLEPSNAVNGDMDKSSSHLHHTCWSRFGKSEKVLGHCLAPNLH